MLLQTNKILADDNIRQEMDPSALEELAASIETVHELSGGEKTLLQPITVVKLPKKTKEGHTHRVRYGFRRLAAMKLLHATKPKACFWAEKIPVIVDDAPYNEEENAITSFRLLENVQRENMTLLEEALAIKRVMKEQGMSQSKVAKALGKSKGWVSQRLSLLKMDETVQLGVQDGVFGQAHVRELGRIKKKDEQKEVATKLLKTPDVTVAEVKKEVHKVAAPKTKKKKKTKEKTSSEAPKKKTKEAPSAEEPSQPPKPVPPKLRRADVLKSMTHEDKVAFLKEEAETRAASPAGDVSTKALEKEVKRCAARAEKASEEDNEAKASFFKGAEQACRFALGSIKSIRYRKKKTKKKS